MVIDNQLEFILLEILIGINVQAEQIDSKTELILGYGKFLITPNLQRQQDRMVLDLSTQ